MLTSWSSVHFLSEICCRIPTLTPVRRQTREMDEARRSPNPAGKFTKFTTQLATCSSLQPENTEQQQHGLVFCLFDVKCRVLLPFLLFWCIFWRVFYGFLWHFARFGGILWRSVELCCVLCHFVSFASLPVSAECLQLLAFTIQPGTDGTLAPTDKISLASLTQAVSLTADYYTAVCGESYRFYKNDVTVQILILIL